MNAHERHRKIAEILHSSPFQSVDQLAATLCVSVATVRRDLGLLSRQSAIRRVHGGAVSLLHRSATAGPRLNPVSETDEDLHPLAEAALATIHDGETIVLDTGKACRLLAAILPRRSHLTVLATSVGMASELAGVWHLRVLTLGGEVLEAGRVTRGAFALRLLEQMYFDRVFLEVSGIDPEKGLTIHDPAEAAIKQALLKQSKQVVLMAPHAIIGHVAPVKLGDAAQAHHVIAHASAGTAGPLDRLQAAGVKVTCV